MTDDIVIPQINPKEKSSETKKAEEESILIPKLGDNKADIKPEKEKKKIKLKKKIRMPKLSIKSKHAKILIVIILVLLGALSISGFLFFRIYQQAKVTESSVRRLMEAVSAQDIHKIKGELENTITSVDALTRTYNSVSFMKVIPIINDYIKDGSRVLNAATFGLEAAEIVVITIEPYADIIGFSGTADEPGSGEETTQDRIDFVVKTIPDIIPKADELASKVQQVQKEVEEIDPSRYPVKLAGFEIHDNIEKAKEMIDLGARLITEGKPLLEQVPYLLGTDEPRTYLIMFQNDKELRPTGGFITAYSIAQVENGKFKPVSSNDIYNLDSLYTPRIPAADPIIDYLQGPYKLSRNYRLRDLNWSPDYYQSMKLFVEEIKRAGITNIDGVIAVDTQLLVYLLDVLGPIGVSGYGNFSTEIIDECNCPQVIYELESFADIEGSVVWDQADPTKIIFAPPNYENRKKIIGPLMNSVLANALGQPKDKLPDLFEAVFKSLLEKHVLFYMLDEDAQAGVEGFGIAGRIEEYDGDYLHINDANLGGRKSNLYVTQEINQEIEITKDGSVEKTVTITYNNPEKYDGWLNSVLPNWVRIYVPKGSELVFFDGVEDQADPYEELGKTVFAGFFELRPQGVAKVTVRYKLPFKVDKEYKMFIQKQPGKDAPLYVINMGKLEEELFLKTDKEFKFKI